MSTKSLLGIVVGIGLVAMAAVLGVIVGHGTALAHVSLEAAPDILPPSGGKATADEGFPWAAVPLVLGGLAVLAGWAVLARRAR